MKSHERCGHYQQKEVVGWTVTGVMPVDVCDAIAWDNGEHVGCKFYGNELPCPLGATVDALRARVEGLELDARVDVEEGGGEKHCPTCLYGGRRISLEPCFSCSDGLGESSMWDYGVVGSGWDDWFHR